MTNPYHRAGDPTRSVHFVIGNRLDAAMRTSDPELSSSYRDPPLSHYVAEGSGPDDRGYYEWMVVSGWYALAFASLVGAFVCGFPVNLLFGERTGQIVAFAFIALGFFCLAGGTNALWRRFWYVPQARRRLRREGAQSARYQRSSRRTLVPNTSLIFQGAVWILAFIIQINSI